MLVESILSFYLTPVLFGTGPSPRDHMIYYRLDQIWAVRKGPFKVHFKTRTPEYGPGKILTHDPPLLYHLEHDPSEKYNIAERHPKVIAELRALAEAHAKTVVPVEDQIRKR